MPGRLNPDPKYEAQRKYSRTHPEKVKEYHAKYIENNKESFNEYHRLYEHAKYEWNTYLYNSKYRYERKLFLNILLI
jgi:hypothetical protein